MGHFFDRRSRVSIQAAPAAFCLGRCGDVTGSIRVGARGGRGEVHEGSSALNQGSADFGSANVAARYARPDEPFDDIFQVACIGLVNAIDRYDLSRGRAFSSFAVPTIAGEIKRCYRDKTWRVHVPRDLRDRTLAVDRAARELESELARNPTVAELADRVSLTHEDVLEALHANQGRRAASLHAPYDDDDVTSLGDTIATYENGFERAEQRASLARLAAILSPRERHVLALRFGPDLTQEEIGQRVGVSQMQISRTLRQAIAKLRAYAASQGIDDLAA